MRRKGVPESEVVFTFTLIQDLEHEIRTAYGDSGDKTYEAKYGPCRCKGSTKATEAVLQSGQ